MSRFLTFVMAGLAISAPGQTAPLKGDPRAVSLADKVVQSIGGRPVWSKASYLRIEEFSFSATAPEGQTTIFCRDLLRPRIKVQRFGSAPAAFVFDGSQGWRRREGTTKTFSPDENRNYLRDWPANIYVMYGRLAREDQGLLLKLESEQEFSVSENGRTIGRFTVDASGHVVRWRSTGATTDDDEDWIYGPAKSFGAVAFPDWGTRTDGSYRFYYRAVEARSGTMRQATFAKPGDPSTSASAMDC